MTTIIMLYFSSIPVELRITIIFSVLLSLTSFFLSAASVFLFYKFYRDTIKPIPMILFQSSESMISLKLINNGHSAFYINKLLVMKNNRITDNIVNLLPLLGNEAHYASLSSAIEGRKVMPDQSIKLFEIDLTLANPELTDHDIKNLIHELNDIIVEVHCYDIGKRYKAVVRDSISIRISD